MTDTLPQTASADAFLDGLVAIVGAGAVLTSEADKAPYLKEWRDLFRGEARAIVRPGSTQEVAAVVRHCAASEVKIVPQGGNTGLVGGQIPLGIDAIVLSTQRLNRIREVDAQTDTITVEAGVTLLAIQQAAEAAERLFPLSLASEGSCTAGGVIGANAGGTAVIAYGNTRDLVLGLEVVTADGEIWNGLGKLRKDNTGYDLKNIFVGSEGTLGIVTAAVFKLFPCPAARATAFCAVESPGAALSLLMRTKAAAGARLTTFEFMIRFGLETVLRHVPGSRDPFADAHPWYTLIELSGADEEELQTVLGTCIEAGLENGEVRDATLAASLDQRAALWKLREEMSDAQRHEGGSIKHDISVPLAAVPAFLEEATAAVLALVPDCRPLPFGHLGDGNIHFNVSQPVGADKEAYLARWDEMNAAVHAVVALHHGSVSAEHGIGRLKRELLASVKDPVALALMRRVKSALDPYNLLNPGAIL